VPLQLGQEAAKNIAYTLPVCKHKRLLCLDIRNRTLLGYETSE
jgi:hypothetical protein